jgi:3-hydroxybutyryl-CoA dehydrogenase
MARAHQRLLRRGIREDPKLKGRVLSAFDAVCPPRTIFTTNTSTLLPSQFADPTASTGRDSHTIGLRPLTGAGAAT